MSDNSIGIETTVKPPENKVEIIHLNGAAEKKSGIFNFNTTMPFSSLIGKGDQAKDSVVWYLITRLVRMSFAVIAVLFAVDIYYNKGVNCMSVLKDTWSVFAPIITLAMGYLFGKKERGKGEAE